jgi:hypothetical protein
MVNEARPFEFVVLAYVLPLILKLTFLLDKALPLASFKVMENDSPL